MGAWVLANPDVLGGTAYWMGDDIDGDHILVFDPERAGRCLTEADCVETAPPELIAAGFRPVEITTA